MVEREAKNKERKNVTERTEGRGDQQTMQIISLTCSEGGNAPLLCLFSIVCASMQTSDATIRCK